MPLHDTPPARGSAAWIARYAAGLLNSTPGMHPLDAVRVAMMDASTGSASHRGQSPSTQRGARQHGERR
jgi:hypothetical protein